jgi:hypothetical protein
MKTFKDFVNENLNEGISIPLKDEYAKQIWDKHQSELMKLVDTINAQDFDHGTSEVICDALSEIFAVLADKPGQAYNYMNK